MEKLDVSVDILSQQPALALYTQITLVYPHGDDVSDASIVKTLTAGLERLSAGFPWTAGQVINEGAGPGNTGDFRIRPFESTPRLIVKDLRQDSGPSKLSLASLRNAGFPMSMLDETVIAPRNTIPGTFGEVVSDAPVFVVQATFITGGLLLTFVGQHQTMDMTGQASVMALLSKACRDEAFTAEELRVGNKARHDVIPLLDDSYDLEAEIADKLVPTPTASDSSPPPSPPPCTWAYFSFTASALGALKAEAMQTVTSGFVSTDDALTALIWQGVTRARLQRLDGAENTSLNRAVDARRFLALEPQHPGVLQNLVRSDSAVEELARAPLGEVAARLRAKVDIKTADVAFKTRALATFFARTPDRSKANFIGAQNVPNDIALSSWSKFDLYGLDFGLGLGRLECVRRPRFLPVESLAYLMPKAPDGEIAAAVCIRDDDLEALRKDDGFMKHARYIG